MNYFIMLQDDRIPDWAEPVGISEMIAKEMLTDERFHELESKAFQVPIQSKSNLVFSDFIERPLPLLSDKLKQLVIKYVPNMPVTSVVLVDRKQMRLEPYWLMMPPRIDCLSEKSEFHLDGTLKKLVIDERKAAPYHLFKVLGIREDFILINLMLAESILRRDFDGICLKKVETEQEGR